METRWGRRFGRYEVVAEVGRGAMGVVYKARDPKIDRFVAVKTISLSGQNPEEEREYRQRFFHEAQAAGRLLHPGIVTIFDTGEDPESHIAYIVMEFIAGQSLDRLLLEKAKKIPVDTALRLAEELAEALDHAHGQGVVHRDMKPANILVTTEGRAKIADFGIAKVNLSHLTIPGRAMGTPAYMSPEQLEGEPVDQRSDLFSLGAILYHIVTGYGPFQGNSATTVCFKVANREPLQPTAFDPDLPAGLDSVIARAMAKDPAQRYQRGLEFALDLRELRERGQTISKGAKSTSPFPGAKEVLTRSQGDVTADGRLANLVPVGFLKMLGRAVRQAAGFTRLHVLSAWRRPVIGLGLAFSVATIIVSLSLHHKGLPSPSSSHIGPTASVSASGAPPPVVNEPNVIDHSAEKVSSSNAAVDASTALPSVVNKPDAADHSVKNVPDSKPLSKPVADSTLNIRIEHRFSAAELSLWIDDKLAYDRPLRGQIKKHWNPFRTDVRETETVRLPSGKHRILVRVQSTPDNYEQSASLLGSFTKDHPETLQINFERQGKAMRLALR
jgi:serine/threonine protein kinase